MTELLTPQEAAARLKVSAAWLTALARGGAIPHVRLGRLYRFEERALDDWLETHRSYTADQHGEATGSRERRRQRLQGAGTPKAVVRRHHRRLDDRGQADPKGALRIVGAGSQGEAA